MNPYVVECIKNDFFCQLIFFVSYFSLSEVGFKLSFWHLLGHVTVDSLYLSVTWHDITYDMGNEHWQVTESEKNHVSGSPLIYASVALLLRSLIIFFFS